MLWTPCLLPAECGPPVTVGASSLPACLTGRPCGLHLVCAVCAGCSLAGSHCIAQNSAPEGPQETGGDRSAQWAQLVLVVQGPGVSAPKTTAKAPQGAQAQSGEIEEVQPHRCVCVCPQTCAGVCTHVCLHVCTRVCISPITDASPGPLPTQHASFSPTFLGFCVLILFYLHMKCCVTCFFLPSNTLLPSLFFLGLLK